VTMLSGTEGWCRMRSPELRSTTLGTARVGPGAPNSNTQFGGGAPGVSSVDTDAASRGVLPRPGRARLTTRCDAGRMSMQADELVIAMLTAQETSERYDLLRTALEEQDDQGVQYLSGVVGRLLAYIDGLREPEENRIALEQYTQRVALQWAQEDQG
jgi:hypothetical protein